MDEPKAFLINFKETANIKDVVLVLNSLSMVTQNTEFIEKLEKNDSIILREINAGEKKD